MKVVYTLLESRLHLVGYNSVAHNTGISICLAMLSHKSAKSSKNLRKLGLIAGQSHPRSPILVPIDSAYATSCISH